MNTGTIQVQHTLNENWIEGDMLEIYDSLHIDSTGVLGATAGGFD